jgi:hypothetical protein
VLASQLPHQQVVLVTPRLAAHAFLPFDLLKGTLNERPPRPVQWGERRGAGRPAAIFPPDFPPNSSLQDGKRRNCFVDRHQEAPDFPEAM